ncbi:hypothetical protein [Thermoflavimicrobium dichotomicum]|uniref:Uncharacterized protein n=1 Tax=Thermoflavimicrobium dichotomicum TaxID=46223 RepID=A0A1I3JHC2_9BACL|nr:hypothetical protein [Thermoflavimicrobium dichotomicum]SFI59378.1 hypothetical protein SAMN05421852_10169 [Thermoflavimicrobium dichotomicum]
MVAIYVLFMLISFFYGIHSLFVVQEPVYAVHMLIFSLYFFITIYEIYGKPFQLPVYYLVTLLLVADGVFQLFFIQSIFHGVISLLFAFSAWQSLKRLKAWK